MVPVYSVTGQERCPGGLRAGLLALVATFASADKRGLITAISLVAALVAAGGAALAAPGEVADLMLDDQHTIRWDLLAGTKGYHVYHTSSDRVAAGDYGDCHVGSHRTNSLTDLDNLPTGDLHIFYVTGFDETGEGSAGLDPAGAERTFATPCVPARRNFDFAVNGDTGDGVLDGVEPARNPSLSLYATSRETTGVYLHSGELFLSARDLYVGEGLWYSAKTPQEKALAPGDLVHFAGDSPGHGRARVQRWGTIPGDSVIECSAFSHVPAAPKETASAALTGNRQHRPIKITKRANAGSVLVMKAPAASGTDAFPGGRLEGSLIIPGTIPAGEFECPSLATCDYYLREGMCDLYNSCYDAHLQCFYGGGRVGPDGKAVVNVTMPSGREDCGGRRDYSARIVDGLRRWSGPAQGHVRRAYRSQVRYNGPLGHGWDHAANERISAANGDIVCHSGLGRADLFLRNGPATFDSPAGIYSILVENPGGSFTRRDPNGTLHNYHGFDGSNLEGAIESLEDRNGNVVAYLYDNQGLLATVVDTMGRSTGYEYDAAGRLTAVVDFAGRRVEYGYDANDDLITVRSPVVTGTPHGNDFPLGKVTTYSYSSGSADPRLNHNLTVIIRPNEELSSLPAIQVAYGQIPGSPALDRVTAQTIGGDLPVGGTVGGTLFYAYDSLNVAHPPDPITERRRVMVTDRNGNQSEFVHNWAGHLLSRTAFTNRDLRPGEPDYTTMHAYDAEGELVETILPEGNRVQCSYDTASPNRGNQGNLLEVRAIADNPGAGAGRGDGHGGSASDRVWTFTYDDYFNGSLSATDPRGNDPAYQPQNGGAQSAARYTTTRIYDHQEGDPGTNGINALGTRFGIVPCVTPLGLGDRNGDGMTGQAGGNPVRVELPAVQLDPLSLQAAIEGDTSQEIVTLYRWNNLGQLIARIDREGNTHEFDYYPETDPDGDGLASMPPDDGRLLDPVTGGYLKSNRTDTTADAGRNNGTNPAPAGIQVDYYYDEVGNVTGIVDGRGVLTRFTINALNQVVQVMTAAATADAAAGGSGEAPTGRGETGLTPHGFLTRYRYDANDNLVQHEVEDRGATRGLGPFISTDWSYDLLDRPLSVARETTPTNSLMTLFAYDANDNLVQVTQPEGNTHQAEWDERDLPLTRTVGASGPRGGAAAVHNYVYDGNGNLTQYNDPLNEQVDHAYDGFDRLAVTTDRIGNTAGLFYDPMGRVVRSLARGPVGGPTPGDRNGAGNEDLAETFFLYDELGRLFRRDRRLFVPAGVTPARTPILTEGPIGAGDARLDPADDLISSLFEHDRLSRLSFALRDSGAMTRYDHDGAGRLLLATLPLGAEVWNYTWDDASNRVATKVTEHPSTGAGGPPAELFLTTAMYDALGRRTMSVDNVGQTSRLQYDSLNAVTAVSDPRGPVAGSSILRRSPGHTTESVDINEHGNVTRRTYDGAGRPLATVQVLTTSGEGDGTLNPPPDDTNSFNADGLITATTIWDDNSLPQETSDDRGNRTTFTFDNLNRMTGIMADDETETASTYDAVGNLVAVTDANGSQIANSFDAAHRLVMVDITPVSGVGGTTEQRFEYDGLGRVTRATDNNDPGTTDDDVTTTVLYDSLSRRFEEGQQIGAGTGAIALHVSHGLQADGLSTDLVYPDGRHVQVTFDGAERGTTIVDLDAAASEDASFDYFGLGRIHTRSYGNGVVSTMLDDAGSVDIGYDGVKRIVQLRHVDAAAGSQHAAFEQRYDRAGNRTSQRRRHHPNGATDARTETNQWDSAGRLTAFEEGFAGTDHVLDGPPDDNKTWALDGTDNWAGMSRNGLDYGSTPNNRNHYNENQSGGMASDDGLPDDFLDDLASPVSDGLNFAHDENGNQVFDGRHTLTFDGLNRLIVALRAADDLLVGTYTYDAFGRRVTRSAVVEPGVNEDRRYLHDGGSVIEERDGAAGAVIRQIVYGPGGPLWQRLAGGSSHYYLEDPNGNVAALFGAGPIGGGGGIAERMTYDPYGKPQLESAGNVPLTDGAGDFAAASQFGNSLLWGARWYDPELGERSDDVNTDWGGVYIGIGDVMGVEPTPFRHVNDVMGIEPTPFRDVMTASGADPLLSRVYSPNLGGEMNQSFNMQYLMLQQKMQAESRGFSLLSNIMKTKHESAKSAINNVR